MKSDVLQNCIACITYNVYYNVETTITGTSVILVSIKQVTVVSGDVTVPPLHITSRFLLLVSKHVTGEI